jgi:small-conductance mechanosensitive channel
MIERRSGYILNIIPELKNKILGEIDFLLIQSNKLALRYVKVEDSISKLDKILSTSGRTIFRRNAPSLIKVLSLRSGTVSLFSQVRVISDGILVDFENFGIAFSGEITLSAIILLILLVSFVYISISLKGRAIDGEKHYMIVTIKVLRKPVTVAFLFFLFIIFFVFSEAPPILQSAISVLVIVPVFIITAQAVPIKIRKYAYLFLLALIPIRIIELLPRDILPVRLLLLGLTIYSIFVLLSMVRRKEWLDEIKVSGIRLLAKRMVYFFLILQIIGLLANLLGYVRIAEWLSNSSIRIILNTLLIYLLSTITKALLIMFFRSRYISSLTVVSKNASIIYAKTEQLVSFLAGIGWFYFVLMILNIQSTFLTGIKSFYKFRINVGTINFSPGDIILFVFVLWLSIVITKLVRAILEDGILPHIKLARGIPETISLLVKYTLITAGIFIAVKAAGMNLDKLTILMGAFGVGIGFGLQNIFNNLVSGLILLFERPIHVNDVVEVGSLIGHVTNIGFRSSSIRTFDGAEVIVPNGHLISNEVVNWTLSDKQRRIDVMIGVAYGSDVDVVTNVLLTVMNNHKEIISDPGPMVYFQEMGESSLDFKVLFWAANFKDWLRIRSEVVYSIYKELNTAGIEIPFPQRDIHLKK